MRIIITKPMDTSQPATVEVQPRVVTLDQLNAAQALISDAAFYLWDHMKNKIIE